MSLLANQYIPKAQTWKIGWTLAVFQVYMQTHLEHLQFLVCLFYQRLDCFLIRFALVFSKGILCSSLEIFPEVIGSELVRLAKQGTVL
jgi:hypothetical protein